MYGLLEFVELLCIKWQYCNISLFLKLKTLSGSSCNKFFSNCSIISNLFTLHDLVTTHVLLSVLMYFATAEF